MTDEKRPAAHVPAADGDRAARLGRMSRLAVRIATRGLPAGQRDSYRDEWSHHLHQPAASGKPRAVRAWQSVSFIATTMPSERRRVRHMTMSPEPLPAGGAVAALSWTPRHVLFAMIGAVMTLTFACFSVQSWITWFTTDYTADSGTELSDLNSQLWTMISLVVLAATVPVFMTFTPLQHAAGLGLPGRRRWVRFVGTTAAVMALLLTTSFLTSWLHPGAGAGVAEGQAWRDNPVAVMSVASVQAGVLEEVTSLLVPALLALGGVVVCTFLHDHLLPLIRIARGSSEPAPPSTFDLAAVVTAPSTWPICIAATVIGLVGRYAGHLYQGAPYAQSALIWGGGMIVLFALTRSIWALIAGHLLHDLLTAGVLPPLSATAWWIYLAALVLIAAAATAATLRAPSARNVPIS